MATHTESPSYLEDFLTAVCWHPATLWSPILTTAAVCRALEQPSCPSLRALRPPYSFRARRAWGSPPRWVFCVPVLFWWVPTINDGATALQGSLLVIDRFGNLVTTLANAPFLDGPWDLTINDQGNSAQIFVSNVLNGTVTRLDVFLGGGNFHVLGVNQIAHGYSFAPNAAAVVVGPTGLAYNPLIDVLYVASTDDNEIFAIPFAGTTIKDVKQGVLIYEDNTHLHGPLGLALAPNGHLIAANGDAVFAGGTQNALVEFTQTGQFVAQYQVDPGAPGAAFGLAISSDPFKFRLAAVDDNQNALDIWIVQ